MSADKIDFTKLKVLHIGNIANNGFMAARILNDAGIESHCLVADYYHINSCPEWEEADFEGDYGDQFYPEWHKVDLKGYQRPRWFAQGPRATAVDYLIAYNEGNTKEADKLWYNLSVHVKILSDVELKSSVETLRKTRGLISKFLAIPRLIMRKTLNSGVKLKNILWRLKNENYRIDLIVFRKIISKPLIYTFLAGLNNKLNKNYVQKIDIFLKNQTDLINKYMNKEFKIVSNNNINFDIEHTINSAVKHNTTPSKELLRLFNTLDNPVEGYREMSYQYDYLKDEYKKLLAYYDVVIGYSTDGIYPLIHKKPYIAFEHGTIRIIPFLETYTGQQAKLVYQNADISFITNYDSIDAVKKLKLQNYFSVPHPTNEKKYDNQIAASELLRSELCEIYGIDYIIFHPTRHHWSKKDKDMNWDKGNDKLIEGFALFNKNKNSLLILVESGQTVEDSKKLIKDLNIESYVLWIKPQQHRRFIQFIMVSDVIADQFSVAGTFGGIPPKAMMCKKPVLTLISPEIHEWAFDETPPFIIAGKADEICKALNKLKQNKEYSQELANKGFNWYQKYYSNAAFLNTIKQAIELFINNNKSKG